MYKCAPCLGEDTVRVLSGLGLSREEIYTLWDGGVIGGEAE